MGGSIRWVGDGETEGERGREKEWEGGKHKLWEGWRRKNDTEIHSSSSAQTQCARFHAILGYRVPQPLYELMKRTQKENENQPSTPRSPEICNI